MKALLALIQKLYGSKALSKTIGTRTNVIKLPDKDTKRFITNELNIDAASDAALEKAYKDVEKLIPEIPKMNDQEILTFTGNLRRLDQRMNPPSAEVIEFGTKQPVSPAGIKQLETELGIPSDVDPQSPLGQIMTKTKQISKQGKDLAKEFGMEDVLRQGLKGLDDTPKTTDELYEQTRKAIEEPTEAEKAFRAKERSRIGQVFDDLTKSQKSFRRIEDEGLVRATVRQILDRDRKSGKVKLNKAEDQTITFQNQGDPIDIFRKYYGEDALEQVDSLVPKFREMRTQQEAADLAQKEFKLEPKAGRNIGSYDPENPPEFATGGRVGFQNGGNIYNLYNQYLQEVQNRAAAQSLGPLATNKLLFTDLTFGGPNVGTEDDDDTSEGLSLSNIGANMSANMGMGNVSIGGGITGANIGGAIGAIGGPGLSAIGSAIGAAIGGLGGMGIGATPGAEDAGSAADGGEAGAAAASAAGSNDGPGGGTFAEGGRVGFNEGGFGSAKDFIESSGDSELMDIYIKVMDGTLPEDALTKALENKGYKTYATGGRVHAAAGLMKGMIKWLVENRNFAKELLDRVSKQKNGEKLIKELYESETKKSGVSPMSMGEAPKTNLPKVRAQKKADEEGIKQLAQDEQIPVRDDTIIPEDVMTVPEPFKGKYKDEFLAHDALYGRRSGDNKVDAEAIAETVADMQGKVYDDLGYSERMDMYDKAYGYLSLLDRVKGAMKESKGRTKQAGGGLAYLMGL